MEPFATLLTAALGTRDQPHMPLAVAVSGGPDSVALLLLAHAAFSGRVTALTVDHGLRPGSADEAATVARHCAAAGIRHVTLVWQGEKPRANLQARARTARYRLMADWCAVNAVPLLATGHHADDQAETLLMRLARGSGSAGLAGIRASRPLGQGVTLVRPLLGVRRAALAQVAAAGGWPLVDDPGNRNPAHDRTHARALLATVPWLDPARLAAAAAHLADAEAALAWATERGWAGRAQPDAGGVTLDVAGLPDALVHRLVTRAIGHLCPGAVVRGPDVKRLIGRLNCGGKGSLAGVVASGGTSWRFRVAPARRPAGGK